MDDGQGLEEESIVTPTQESLSREGTRDGEHQPLLNVSVAVCLYSF